MTRDEAILAPGRHRAVVHGQLSRDGIKAIGVSIDSDDPFDPEWSVVLAKDESDRVWLPGETIRGPYALCVRVYAHPPQREDEPPRAHLGLVVKRVDD